MGSISSWLHSGALSTMIDFGTTVSILTFDKRNRGTQSASMSLSYFNDFEPNTDIYILSQIDRIARHVAYSHSTIYGSDGRVLAVGNHMKKFTDFIFYYDGSKYIYSQRYTGV